VSLPQFMACAGICAGYFTCYGSVRVESSFSWRGLWLLSFFDALFSELTQRQHPTSFKPSSDSY